MAFMDKLKGMFGGGKKKSQDQEYWEAWDQRVTAMENKVTVSQNVRLITGGLPEFETHCSELTDTLGGMLEGERKAKAEAMLKRIEIALAAAHLIREEGDDDARKKQWAEFLQTLKDCRNVVHYKTRVKYDRLRLDHESGKLK